MPDNFARDDAWQRSKRDAILVPGFYERYAAGGRYVFIDKGRLATLLQKQAVDTIVQGKAGAAICIEEKIVRWPARGCAYTASSLETHSCIKPGYESERGMSACLAEIVVEHSTARHAVATFLGRYDLPSDCEALAAWFYGRPEQVDGGAPAYGSPELVLGAAPVRPVGADLFEIDEDAGKMAVLQPVGTLDGEILDLIAWHPARPDRWRFLTGHAEALGEGEIALRQDRDGPLRVYATPLSWHRAGGRGVCLLRRSWQLAQRLFVGERELIAETVELGNQLDQLLRFRPSPAIRVERAAWMTSAA